MRPVIKWSKLLPYGTLRQYAAYGDAKQDLMDNLGAYCSYCELWTSKSHLEVEHVEHKDQYPKKALDWNNFLLACKNCNTIKGTKDVNTTPVFLPHLHNTFKAIEVLEGGLIIPNRTITDPLVLAKVQATIDFTGLDRAPGHPQYSNKDNRWESQKAAWGLATRYLLKWKEGSVTIVEDIVDVAAERGFWSIWMNVFAEEPEVKNAFIQNSTFAGTCTSCFDAAGEVLNRNGTDL